MPSDPEFDVFLSHNSKDKPAVRRLADALEERGVRAWLAGPGPFTGAEGPEARRRLPP